MKKALALLLSVMMVISMAACASTPAAPASSETPAASSAPASSGETASAAATGTGTAKGFGGDITATVTMNGDKIENIEVVGKDETAGIGAVAVEKLPANMLKAQSVNVDVMAGATISSKAIIEAVSAAITASGADISKYQGSAAAASGDGSVETVDVDIAVIGSGGAGMAAAIEAKAAGKNVVIIEKMAMMGGNTTKATGGMNAAETSVQKAAGVEDSVQLMIDDAMKGGGNINDKELVTALATNSAAAIDWLASIGAPLPDLTTLAASSAKRAHRPEGGGAVGSYLVEKLSAYIAEQKIPVYLNTKATELITDNGAVVGVKATGEDKNYIFNAKAVVLATGGFGANEELYTKYRPELKGFVTTNTPGATGDGIVMAEAVGAKLTDIEQIQIHPTVHQATSIMITEGLRGDGAILVNKEGKRFVNEMETRAAVSAAELEQTDGCAYLVFDQALRERVKAVESYVKNNILVEGATVEELAKNLNMDPAVLKETIDTWNKAIADKNDPAFGRATGLDYDITKGPFYASLIAPGVHHTMGGVTINTNAEVINTEGNVITGLYAAGEVTGGIHGNNRLGGNAVADIIVFGRQAGQSAAAFAG